MEIERVYGQKSISVTLEKMRMHTDTVVQYKEYLMVE